MAIKLDKLLHDCGVSRHTFKAPLLNELAVLNAPFATPVSRRTIRGIDKIGAIVKIARVVTIIVPGADQPTRYGGVVRQWACGCSGTDDQKDDDGPHQI